MKKTWAIVFLVVVSIWIAFLAFRHFKTQEETEEHVAQTFSTMTTAAQKSPKAGLTYMGMAIKRYKSEKKQYPETLEALYPDYIKDRSFIDEVDWEYAFSKDDFQLAKTIVINQTPYTAFVDSQLRPMDVGADGEVRTAAAGRQATSSGATAPQPGARSSPRSQASAARTAPPPPERTMTKDELAAAKEQLLASLVAAGKQGPYLEEEKEATPPVVYTPVDEAKEVGEAVAGKHLTWKTQSGALGFGNVMYPGGEDNLIYRNGKWIRVHRTREEAPSGQVGQPGAGQPPEDIDLARKHGRDYLAWKDKSGAMGFGNVSYPEKEEGLIYQNGKWVKAGDRPADKPVAGPVSPPPAPDTGEVAKKYAGSYLTWKDKSGALGFGNILPEKEGLAIMKPDGTWVDTSSLSEPGGVK